MTWKLKKELRPMKHIKQYLSSLAVVFLAGLMLFTESMPQAYAEAQSEDDEIFTLESPSSKIVTQLYLEDGIPTYSVAMDQQTVILPSQLGIKIEDNQVDQANNEELAQSIKLVETSDHEENYTIRGNRSETHSQYRKYLYEIDYETQTIGLEINLWDDGMAFRYIFNNGGILSIDEELSTFSFPNGTEVWYQMDNQAMQSLYEHKLIEDFSGREIITASSTFELPEGQAYVNLSEAELKDFAGIAYKSVGDNSVKAHYWSSINGFETTADYSPWRLAIITDNLNDLVNNTLALDVSQEPSEALLDADWIESGKAVWFEGYDNQGNIIEDQARASLEASTQLGIKYHVIGNNWRKWGETIEEALVMVKPMVELAAEYEIGIFIGHDVPNLDLYPDGNLFDKQARQNFLRQAKDAGVAGIKFGHIESETLESVNIYRTLLEEVADLELLAIFHNSNKPTGLSRTYPNLLTQEGVRGMQYNLDALNNTILPFTRFVAGGADYTPINFTDNLRLGDGTWPQMLANAVIFESSLLTFIESPVVLASNQAADFISLLPATWDESIVLDQSKIGDMAVYARRTGEDWVIAVQNAPAEVKELEIPLDFLSVDQTYSSLEYHDDLDNKMGYQIQENNYTSKDVLTITVNQGGGFVAYLKN